jgi:hypothetical protein
MIVASFVRRAPFYTPRWCVSLAISSRNERFPMENLTVLGVNSAPGDV